MMIDLLLFDPPAVEHREIVRYAGAKENSSELSDLIDDCLLEALPVCSYRVCCTRMPVQDGAIMLTDGAVCHSDTMAKALDGCDEAILFAATIGMGIDRLISRYSRTSPSRALVLQAIGAERIESLCNAFCCKLNTELSVEKKSLRTRVSPGYGDIPLLWQRDIFAVLDCPRKIGLSLNDSLLMSPSKSVTAIAGIAAGCDRYHHHSCASCDAKECVYRGNYES